MPLLNFSFPELSLWSWELTFLLVSPSIKPKCPDGNIKFTGVVHDEVLAGVWLKKSSIWFVSFLQSQEVINSILIQLIKK